MYARLLMATCLTLAPAALAAQTAPPAVSAAPAPTAGVQPAAPPAPTRSVTTARDAAGSATTEAPIQVRIGPSVEGWIDAGTFLTSFWEELPKLFIAGLVGWFVAVRVTNKWDLAKKRNEFDLQLTTDFYSAIGTFKAVGRQVELLGPPPSARAITERQRWEERRNRVLDQSIALESQIDAILAKAILEDRADDSIDEKERARRLHVAGMLRVSVRNLREGIQHGRPTAPRFGSSAFWLSNRIVSDLGEVLYARALRPSDRKPKSREHSADYLTLVDYRTADLNIAAARLGPASEALRDAALAARLADRRANVSKTFRADGWGRVTELTGPPVMIPVGATLAIEFAPDRQPNGRAPTDQQMLQAAGTVFQRHHNLLHYLVLADGEARLVHVSRHTMAMTIYLPMEKFPAEDPPGAAPTPPLPFAAEVKPPIMAAALLAWQPDQHTLAAMRKLATAPIHADDVPPPA